VPEVAGGGAGIRGGALVGMDARGETDVGAGDDVGGDTGGAVAGEGAGVGNDDDG
jgi:hypothetical protein